MRNRLNMIRVRAFARDFWNSLLGIAAELVAIGVFILAGLIVCLVWWRIFR